MLLLSRLPYPVALLMSPVSYLLSSDPTGPTGPTGMPEQAAKLTVARTGHKIRLIFYIASARTAGWERPAMRSAGTGCYL